MRSCALRILEAETISIALVIFRVFCTLRIFTRISFVPGICPYVRPATVRAENPRASARLVSSVLLPVLDGFVQLRLIVLGEVLDLLHTINQVGVLAFQVVAHGMLGSQRAFHI